jgi:hypothetical protein
VQFSKTPYPTELTPSDIITTVRFKLLANAYRPILTILDGIDTDFNEEYMNASSAIVRTVVGIVTYSMLSQR